jgi:hypothetical protein
MRTLASATVAALALIASTPARATFHLWEISEVFSNANGSVQFVEFETNSALQNFLVGQVLRTEQNNVTLQSFTFPSNLPLQSTQDRFFLVATPGFQAVAGIEPDFEIPVGFIEVGVVDELELVGADDFGFLPSELPTDGLSSLNALGGGSIGVAAATPTNFAGQTGTLPEPGAAALGLGAGAALAGLGWRRSSRRRLSSRALAWKTRLLDGRPRGAPPWHAFPTSTPRPRRSPCASSWRGFPPSSTSSG